MSVDRLPVEGRGAALLSTPTRAGARPLLVAAHGRDDVPEPLGAMWTRLIGERAFVLCPRGIDSAARPGTFTFESPGALADEIDDAAASLRARFADRVTEGPLVYAGFSLGAFYGVRVVARAPRQMPRVVLIEGGHDSWDPATIASFADGGERVLFVSGQRENLERSVRVARELERAGVLTRIEHAEGAGHVYVGEVEARLRDAFGWVVEGDPRWS